MPPRQRRPNEVPLADVAQREEITQLRRQVDLLTQQLAALQAPPPEHLAESASDEDEDINPFAPRAPRQRDVDCRWETGFRVDIPEFTGDLAPDSFVDWLSTVEEVLDFKEVPSHSRVPLVTTRLRSRAQAWWQQHKGLRLRHGKPKITSWEKFKKHMKSAFLPYNYERELYHRLQHLRQGPKSVDEYTQEFYQLLARADLSENSAQLVSRYIGGLRLPIQDVLNMFDPFTVSEAHQRALQAEKQLARRAPTLQRIPSATPPTPPHPTTSLPATAHSGTRVPVQTSFSRAKCFNCGEPGHRIAECRQPPSRVLAALAPEEPSDLLDVPDAVQPDTEIVEGDIGPLLVVRRACLTPRVSSDDWLRNAVFQSTCTISGKVCHFIVDSGSCENVISESAVEKLGLVTVTHPRPYKLAWLSRGAEILVSKRVLVSLSIGSSYSDDILCDVVPMDACHVLFKPSVAI